MSEPIDWDALMQLGLGALRLPPDVFWNMTPWEFACAMQGAGLSVTFGTAPGRTALDQMMAAFPDKAARNDGGD